MADTLTVTIDAWRRTKHPRFAVLATWATRAALTEARPPVGVSGKAKDVAAWDEVFARRDALDLPRLFDTLAAGKSKLAAERLTRFAAWNDPRVVTQTLALLEQPPFRAGTAMAFFRAAVGLLVSAEDPRVRPALDELSRRYKSIIETSIGDVVTALLVRTIKSLKEISPAPLTAADEALAAKLEAHFEKELLQTRKATTTKRSSTANDEALLATVYANPDDDAPREVFADALLERGDVRGEFIRLQLLRARGQAGREAIERERELCVDAKRYAAFGQPLSAGGDCVLVRGFPLSLLPRTPKLLVGQAALRTVREVSGVDAMSLKAAKEVLLHPHAQNVRSVRHLNRNLFDTLPDTLSWDEVTLRFVPSAHDLKKLPALTRLKVSPLHSTETLTQPLLPTLEEFRTNAGVGDGVLASLTGVKRLAFNFHQGSAAALLELKAMQQLRALHLHELGAPSQVDGLALEALEISYSGDDATVSALLDALPGLTDLAVMRKAPAVLVKQLKEAGARARRLKRLANSKFTLEHPFTPEAKLTVYPGFNLVSHVKDLVPALADLPEGCVTQVVLKPELGQEFRRRPSPPADDALEALQRANPVLQVSLEWY